MTSPEAPQPKQWNRSGTPPTDREGVTSSWNGQHPTKPWPARLQLDPGCGDHLVDRVRSAHLCDVDRTAREPPHGSITRPAAGARFGNAESRIVYERTISLNPATSMWTSTSSA